MHSHTFRRLAGEIIPVAVFSCAVLLLLALARYAFVPLWQGYRAANAEVSHFKTLVSDQDRYGAIRARLLGKQQQLAQAYGRLAPLQSGPAAGDLSDLLQLLIARAREADIRFVKMLPQQETRRQAQSEYPVILEMTTAYNSLGRFVSSLEDLPWLFRVERLAITAQKNGLNVRILVTCFLAKTE
jgi:Tfp pilus assembly protein PilO